MFSTPPRSPGRALLVAAVILLVGILCRAPAALAIGQAVGRVTGAVVEDQTEAPVPGAAVLLSGGSGVKKATTTAEDGTFEIDEVPPGTYDLELSYPGMKSLRRRVVVNPDAATPVQIRWSAEAASEETTVVEEERHLTNPDSSQTGEVFSTERTNQLPLARSYQSVTQQVAGVTVTNGGNPNVKGASLRNNRFILNGLDTTDPVTNTFSANYQQDALETIQVATGGFEAKYNALGAIISIRTRRGTNEHHGAVSSYFQPSQFVDYSTFGPEVYSGNKPWDYSRVRPNQLRYELNVTEQGPIVRDYLFYNLGVQYSQSNAVQPAGPPRFVQAPSRKFQSVYLLGGVSFAPSSNHRFHFEATGDPTTIDYENNSTAGTALLPGANNATPLSQRGRFQGGYRVTGEWAWQVNEALSTKLMAGFNENKLDVGPQGLRGIDPADSGGVAYAWTRAQHFNGDDATWWFNDEQRDITTRQRFQLDGAITLHGEWFGRHEAEFGFQAAFFGHREEIYNTGAFSQNDPSGWGIAYRDRGGGPLDSGLCDLDPGLNPGALQGNYTGNGCFERIYTRNYIAHQYGRSLGLFIQDRWKPYRWLTVLPGLRFDTGSVSVSDGGAGMSGRGFGPRLSLIADVTGDEKTIVQASYGRMTEMPFLLGVADYDQQRRGFAYHERYNPTTRRFEFFQTVGGAQGVDFGGDRHAASVDEILLSARREVTDGATFRADYTFRDYHNMFTRRDINAIMDPTGTRTIGFVNRSVLQQIIQYGFDPRAYNKYSGLDLIAELKYKNFEFQGGYTLSWSWGPGYDPDAFGTAFENPRFSDLYYSFQNGVDTRHALKTSTTYSIHGFNIGLIVNWRSGVAMRKQYPTNESGYTVQRAPTGYEPGARYNTGTSNPGQLGSFSDVRSWTEFRTPDLLTCSLMLGYDFFELTTQHITLNVSVDNVLALTTPTSLSTTEGAPNTNQFGLAGTRLGFRTFTAGLRYDF